MTVGLLSQRQINASSACSKNLQIEIYPAWTEATASIIQARMLTDTRPCLF